MNLQLLPSLLKIKTYPRRHKPNPSPLQLLQTPKQPEKRYLSHNLSKVRTPRRPNWIFSPAAVSPSLPLSSLLILLWCWCVADVSVLPSVRSPSWDSWELLGPPHSQVEWQPRAGLQNDCLPARDRPRRYSGPTGDNSRRPRASSVATRYPRATVDFLLN